MKTTETKHGDEPRQSGIGPGERLQAARIQQGLSLDEVADRMHLSIDILKAIEDNNFEEITAPIFVKGYLRAYARIVALNEDEMILQYRDFYSEEDPPISSTSNILPELSAGDARIKWTTYLVVVVIAVLLAAWWWNTDKISEAPISLDSQSTEQRAAADAEEISSEIQAVSEDPETSAAATEPAPTQQGDAAEPTLTEPVAMPETAAPESVAVEPVAVEPDAVEPVAVEPVAVEPDAGAATIEQPATATAETAAVTRTEPQRLAPSGSDNLLLVITADTWTDVKDANNYQLVYDLLRAGSSVELKGEAPFRVFLGNGHGVEIRINGEAVDISRRIRDDNTARLRVGS